MPAPNYLRRTVRRSSPMDMAKRQAGRFTAAELATLRARTVGHLEALRSGKATRADFAGVCTACKLGQAIEDQRVVRGLREVFKEAEQVLLLLQDQAEAGGAWDSPVLTGPQITLLAEMVRLHLFQLAQLSYGEYQSAWKLVIGRATSERGEILNPPNHETAH